MGEYVEEYTVWTKKVLRICIFVILGLHLLLFFSELPAREILIGIVAHIFYLLLLKDFPFISVKSPIFLSSAALLAFNHAMWFFYFSSHLHDFNHMLALFVTCIWFVPFIYIISISANDNTLPYGIISSSGEEMNDDSYGGRKRGKRMSTFMSILNFLKKKKDDYIPSFSSRNTQKLY
ncbi:hypothetical protein PROFUN_07946 [Planoprotostelium fungivorum]|uniref:Protein TEX261 n=1 Tax=Planoprotostelium fungivorum TaxID=1890364 RepID=A0A2P6NL79_9EUKA|nr:hypothetical protein PROFUN_07946 [Planoprotostelium fungivorum]